MLVKELIKILEEQNEDDQVMFSYNYGDHWNTEVAEPVLDVYTEEVKWSEYHNKYAVLDENDSGIFKTAVIIKG
jgi:hypothetical protein